MMSSLIFRLRSLFRRKSMESALDEEVQSHLRMAMQERLAHGESAEQARTAALREFGNVGLVKEVARDMWGWRIRETLLKDMLLARAHFAGDRVSLLLQFFRWRWELASQPPFSQS